MPRERSCSLCRRKRAVIRFRAAVQVFRIAAFLPFAAAPLFGWGCEGHQAVALIARAHLSNSAAQAVDRLLRDNPVDPSLDRFCKDRPADLMADVSTWADDVRKGERTGAWHYVDIPLSVTHEEGDVSAWCPPVAPAEPGKDRTGCVVNAISYNLAIVRDTSRNGVDRANALRYVIHFVGDLHQPLHTEDNNDRGGNCTALTFFSEERPANLHAIWDYKLIQHELELKHQTTPQFASALDQNFSQHWAEWGEPKADPVAWAWEGHKLARTVVYGDLNPHIPLEQLNPEASCDAERQKVTDLHIAINAAYFEETEPTIEQQLAKAGYRLAAILNQTFGQ